jgi:glycosyltransferase involved in cell wall biosynthesis
VIKPAEVSVVIPTRNRPDFVRRAVAEAGRQEEVTVEIIVVDDRSSPPLSLPGSTVVRLDEPTTLGAVRNAGIDAASAPWVAFLDDDDLWAPDKLRRQLAVAGSSGAEFIYTACLVVDSALRPIEAVPAPKPDEARAVMRQRNPLYAGASSALVRSQLLRDVGGFDGSLHHLADWDLWLRLLISSQARAVDELLVAYVRHDDAMISTAGRDLFEEFDYLRAKHEGKSFGDATHFANWAARSHRSAGRRRQAAMAYLRGARRSRDSGLLLRAGGALFGERLASAHQSVRRVSRSRQASGNPPVEYPKWFHQRVSQLAGTESATRTSSRGPQR